MCARELVLKRRVRMSETDATGTLYFTNALKFATEVFEELIGFDHNRDYLLPIVSAKSTFLAPLFLGDEIEISLKVGKIGTSSVEICTEIKKEGKIAAQTEIVHVALSKITKEKMDLPESLCRLLSLPKDR
jgi:acyl-CoA thioesterase FadM